jgi:hypothetical protein
MPTARASLTAWLSGRQAEFALRGGATEAVADPTLGKHAPLGALPRETQHCPRPTWNYTQGRWLPWGIPFASQSFALSRKQVTMGCPRARSKRTSAFRPRHSVTTWVGLWTAECFKPSPRVHFITIKRTTGRCGPSSAVSGKTVASRGVGSRVQRWKDCCARWLLRRVSLFEFFGRMKRDPKSLVEVSLNRLGHQGRSSPTITSP